MDLRGTTCAVALLGVAACGARTGLVVRGDAATDAFVAHDAGRDAMPRDAGPAIDAGPPEPGRLLALGGGHTCLVRRGGVLCWGANSHGQLGDGTRIDSSRPVAVVGVSDAIGVAAGGHGASGHSCAVRATGAVVCWGRNSERQLGDGTLVDRHAPTPVVGLVDAIQISAGDSHTCALRSSGEVVCWGEGGLGQLGDGTVTSSPTPVTVVGLHDAVEVAAGDFITCARHRTGAVSCWGDAYFGLGDGPVDHTDADCGLPCARVPVDIVGISDAIGITTTCALHATGAVSCWGLNDHGYVGDGTNEMRPSPAAVLGLSDATQLGPGTCVLHAGGAVSCWGENGEGQLGDGTTTDRNVPTRVVGLDDAIEVTGETNFEFGTTAGHTCARRASGTVVCWGLGADGELGDGVVSHGRTCIEGDCATTFVTVALP